MSTTVDNRVVEMRFDNKQFESNVQTTLSTLDKLKRSLNLDGAAKGLQEVDAASKKCDMSSLGGAIETVHSKFSALQVMGVTALANITNSAVNAGKRMVSALTIDPIKTGFTEYETKMGAIQTIMSNTASKGSTMQDVTRVINELNTYADKTIYNFAEMTKNIGTFTAAGVGLEESAAAIQGIANLAAASGSTSQQASTAMYQLSQALSSGTVKLMDWNSVVNAGMGGEKFQEALKATAREHGVAVDNIIKKNGSFRDSLQDGWLSADILNETLNKFTVDGATNYAKSMVDAGKWTQKQADALIKEAQAMEDAATKVKTFTQLWDTLKESAQSGWAQTWEIVVGDFEEAKGTLTEISETIGGMLGKSADARNKVLSGALTTGWKQLLSEGIDDAAGFQETITKVAKKHGVDVSKMIDDETTFQDTLKEGWLTGDMLTESVSEFTKELSGMSEKELEAAGYTEETVIKLKKLNKQVKDGAISMEEFAEKIAKPSGRELLIESLWNAFNGLLSVIKPIKQAFSEIFPPATAEQLYSLIERFHAFTEKLTISEDTADKLRRTFKGVFALLDIGVQAVKALFGGFSKLVGYMAPAGNGLLGFTAKIGDFIVGIDEAIKSSDAFNKIIEAIGSFLKPIADGIKTFAKTVVDSFSGMADTVEGRFEPLKALGSVIKSLFSGLASVFQKIAPWLAKAASSIGEFFTNLMNSISSSIQNADYNGMFDALNGGILSAIGIFIAKFIKSGSKILDNAGGFLESINDILGGVSDSLNAFTESIKAKTLKTIATAIAILAGSLFVLSLIDSEKLTDSLKAITVLFVELTAALSIFGKISDGKSFKEIGRISRALVTLSSALLVLALAMKIMSTMSWDEMKVGLTAMTVGLGALVAAVNLLPKESVNKAAKAIKKLSTALLILSVAIKIMSTMSWDEMKVGLTAMTVGLGALVVAVRLLPKDTALRSLGLISLATAMVILAGALKIMSTMSWEEVIKSLATLAGSLFILCGAMALMKKAIPGAAAMLIVAPALVILAGALKIMSTMSWEEVIKSLATLAGSLFILCRAMALMKKAIPGVAAMLIIAPALVVLAGALKIMGSMSWSDIVRGLTILAGAFTIIGFAAKVLKPLVGTILALSGAIALLGVACLAVGAGVALLAVGLGMLAVSGAAGGAALIGVISGIIGLIPYFIEQVGVGIINLCEVISGSAAAICKAVSVIIVALVDALVAAVPAVAEGALILVESLLTSLAKHTPAIVNSLFDFLIALLNGVAAKLPELIKAGVNVLMSFFSGVIAALGDIDIGTLVQGIAAVGLLSGIVMAMASIAGMIPAALVGVLGFGVVVSELAIVLAAVGALAQIPGLEWLISEGGQFMQTVGTAIGQFFGGIIGGFAQGMTSALPKIGMDLSLFMINIRPFLEGAKSIDPAALTGVKSLVGVILAITAANVLEGLASWLTGGSSIESFAKELPKLGEGLSKFSSSVSGIDTTAITAAAQAAKELAKMADIIPNEGGVVSWFAGDNSVAGFADQLPKLGEGLSKFSTSVEGINPENIKAAAEAAKALTAMADTIPNEGGVTSWFAGDNSIAGFADQLPKLGEGLSKFSSSVEGIVPENITAAAAAAKALTAMADTIPNEGGMVSWFTGDNSIANFAGQLPKLGLGLSKFSASVENIVPENITAATQAAKALAEMANTIPNEGGIVSWFAGDNSIANFADQLPKLGLGLSKFSASVEGIVPENITGAANAAKALAEMADTIPNEGGIAAWFTGESSITNFADQLPKLGKGLLGFSTSVEGIVPGNITAASNAAKSLATMADTIPSEGGIGAWFTGETSIANFADQLPKLGKGLLDFSTSVEGITPANITAAANAAKSLATMADTIPSEGGIGAWFTGETSIANFAEQLPKLGKGLLGFSTSVEGIVPENITAASTAAKSLAEMANTIPTEGGIAAWFTGETSISNFASQLPILGAGLKKFSDSAKGIKPETVTAAADAAKSLASVALASDDIDTDSLVDFGESIVTFGGKLSSFFTKTKGVTTEAATTVSSAIKSIKTATSGLNGSNLSKASEGLDDMVKTIKGMSGITEKTTSGFVAAMKKVGESNVSALLKAFKDGESKLTEAGKSAMEAFIKGLNNKTKPTKDAVTKLASDVATAAKSKHGAFKEAGKHLGNGLVEGINAKKQAAYDAGYALGQKAVQGEKDGQKSKSPSRLTIQAGKWLGEGLIIGMERMGSAVYNSGRDLGKNATTSISSAISRISDTLNGDMEMQPTIRPVVDLSAVSAGAGAINGMFGFTPSVGVLSNVRAINSMMNRNQNGGNKEVVSAIKDLKDVLGNATGDSYTINGVTYSEGSDVSDAVKTLVRAVTVGGRK